ncbi:MAG TPA: glycine cleavage system protein GcvH [Candidatus Acidoferrum sp.]|nr:glycine cleavage system protein GcvH [Candidatus Acidoferrum sp.]
MKNQIPEGVLHAKTHEWVRLREGVATIGLSDHAQHELTDVVFVELPAAGRVVQAGAACAVVESVKTASDVYAPVSGEVTAVNAQLARHPELVNSDPYGEGWFFQVKLSRPAELNGLLKPADYAREIGGQV